MAQWIPHSKYSSKTPRTETRTAYLSEVRSTIEAAIRDYFIRNPSGTEVTLACLDAVGLKKATELAAKFNTSMRTVTQDLGLATAIALIDMVGEANVETYRVPTKPFRNSARTRGKHWANLTWVSRYTPHRLTSVGLSLLLED